MKKLGKMICVVLAAISMLIASTPVFAEDASPQSSDAYKLYLAASKKMENTNSLNVKGTVKIDLSLGGDTSMSTAAKYTCQMLYKDKNELQMALTASIDDLDTNFAAYYKDGYYYENSDGVKTKAKTSFAETWDSLPTSDLGLSEDLFKDATVEAVDGGKRIKLKLSSKYLYELIDAYDVSGFSDDDDIKLGNMYLYITIGDNGNIKAYKLVCNMTMKDGDAAYKIKATITMNIVSANKLTKINYPSDLSSYK